MRDLKLSSLLLSTALLAGCGQTDAGPADAGPEDSSARASERSWPEGCVLAVDNVPIFEHEIDEASAWVAMIDPSATAPHLRRLALTNVVLPRVLAGLVAPEEREQALLDAEAQLAILRAGSFVGVPDQEGALGRMMIGTWQEIGIPNWGAALQLPLGEWSEVIEDTGSFAVFRILTRGEAPVSQALSFRIDLFAFPYLPAETGAVLLDGAYDRHTLTFVDEAWRELVPEQTQFRMGAHRPAASIGRAE